MSESLQGRGWPRAVALLGVVFATSVFSPVVSVAVPFVLLLVARRAWNANALLFAALALLTITSGPTDTLWFAERGWALLVGGAFLAASLAFPGWTFSSRSLGAVGVAFAGAAVWLGVSPGAWAALDWAITDTIRAGMAASMQILEAVPRERPIQPATVAAMARVGELWASLYPGLVAVGSVASLGVASWIAVRLTGGGDQSLGPLAQYRFNDHLTWLMIGGLLLLVLQVGEGPTRIGANVTLFMAALYAARGAGVVVFASGGLSLFAYVMLALTLLIAAPFVVATATLIGIGDTWLDIRARLSEATG